MENRRILPERKAKTKAKEYIAEFFYCQSMTNMQLDDNDDLNTSQQAILSEEDDSEFVVSDSELDSNSSDSSENEGDSTDEESSYDMDYDSKN